MSWFRDDFSRSLNTTLISNAALFLSHNVIRWMCSSWQNKKTAVICECSFSWKCITIFIEVSNRRVLTDRPIITHIIDMKVSDRTESPGVETQPVVKYNQQVVDGNSQLNLLELMGVGVVVVVRRWCAVQ